MQPVRSTPHRFRIPGLVLTLALGIGAACDTPSVTESLEKTDEKEVVLGPDDVVKKRPTGLPEATDAEFRAWNRHNPAGEKHLYKWDKKHLKEMLGYWEELECFREELKREGDKAFGAEPGSPLGEQWYQFKAGFVPHVNGWQQRILANVPRWLDSSKFPGNFFQAHEMVMKGYREAYNAGNKKALMIQDAEWDIVMAKNKKYVKSLGGQWPERDLSDPKVAAAHKKVCDAALKPPDTSGKAKKRTRR